MMTARRIFLSVAILATGCSGAPSRTGPANAGRPGDSWAAFDKMWDTVRNDPKRMQLLFGEHFHVENFGSGTCPLPYTAHHRLKVAWKEEGERRLIVVNRQAVLPLQNTSVPDYHVPSFDEEELIFDDSWRLLSSRTWTWGGQEEKAVGGPGFYGRWKTGYRHCAYRREEGKFVCVEGPQKGTSWTLDDSLPPTQAAELLFRVGVDFAKGNVIATRRIPAAGAQEEVFTLAEPEWGEKKLRVEIGDWDYLPSKGEYGWGANQCGAEFKTCSQEDFRKALSKFMTDLRIDNLADKDGRPVEPPLGLEILAK